MRVLCKFLCALEVHLQEPATAGCKCRQLAFEPSSQWVRQVLSAPLDGGKTLVTEGTPLLPDRGLFWTQGSGSFSSLGPSPTLFLEETLGLLEIRTVPELGVLLWLLSFPPA